MDKMSYAFNNLNKYMVYWYNINTNPNRNYNVNKDMKKVN